MEIKNLTPHALNLKINGEYVEYPPDGKVPRLSTVEVPIEGDFPFEAVTVEYGDIRDLPDPEEGIILVVSKMCADARPERRDLWYPTRFVRDETGRIVGCDALARIEP